MSCPTLQKNGTLCNRPIKLGSCCGYHRTYKNSKKLNEEYKLYKKNRLKNRLKRKMKVCYYFTRSAFSAFSCKSEITISAFAFLTLSLLILDI